MSVPERETEGREERLEQEEEMHLFSHQHQAPAASVWKSDIQWDLDWWRWTLSKVQKAAHARVLSEY